MTCPIPDQSRIFGEHVSVIHTCTEKPVHVMDYDNGVREGAKTRFDPNRFPEIPGWIREWAGTRTCPYEERRPWIIGTMVWFTGNMFGLSGKRIGVNRINRLKSMSIQFIMHPVPLLYVECSRWRMNTNIFKLDDIAWPNLKMILLDLI